MLTGVWTAGIATFALKTWQRQAKAKKQTDFLDELTDSVQEFVTHISRPISEVRFLMMSIESHANTMQLEQNLENPEAVAYIKRQGLEDAKRLLNSLEPCTAAMVKINALVIKGSVFDLKNYSECEHTCMILDAQLGRIQALCHVIGSPSLNWENPKVQQTLSAVLQISAPDLTEQIIQLRAHYIAFVKKNYASVYS